MYCSMCGKEINDYAVICPNCGCTTKHYKRSAVFPDKEINKILYLFLGFIFPPIGFLLYFFWKTKHPTRAEYSRNGALICLSLLFFILMLDRMYYTIF